MTSSSLTTSENSLLPRSNLSNCVSLWMDLRENIIITTTASNICTFSSHFDNLPYFGMVFRWFSLSSRIRSFESLKINKSFF